ncbi:hypothetical protein [Paenibacillus ginsengarvi]|uniref:Uncharacterized protein n=1 Tax=Paenibacillus ginsengarvi TaxID=400777 RepID=A0A3B0BD02_9BACL|nr:hypothetical protein [Paenibacillus ginsengarvi]RKN70562.1 hypothetical protein D7M11_30300 [Paenibacillus ginsengarvi]
MSNEVKPNQFVTLLGANPTGNEVSTFSIVNPNATLSPFAIPEKKVFIVTDMDITFGRAAANKSTSVQLLLFGANTLSAFQDATTADSSGTGGLQASLATGVVIARNTIFGVRATSDTLPVGVVVNLHGYFAKADD